MHQTLVQGTSKDRNLQILATVVGILLFDRHLQSLTAPTAKLCRNYPLGTCRYGEHCSYLHILPVPSPATSPIHTLARPPFFPSIAPSLSFPLSMPPLVSHTPTSPATTTPSYHTRSEARAQAPHRDVRPRAPRPDGPRRFAPVAQACASPASVSNSVSGSGSGSEVERWRLAVSADGAHPPPAPPATPVSFAQGSPAPRITRRDGMPSGAGSVANANEGLRQSKERWAADGRREGEMVHAYPSIAVPSPRQYPMSKPVRHRNQYFKSEYQYRGTSWVVRVLMYRGSQTVQVLRGAGRVHQGRPVQFVSAHPS